MTPVYDARTSRRSLSLTLALLLGLGLVLALVWILALPLRATAQPAPLHASAPSAPGDQTIVLTKNEAFYDAAVCRHHPGYELLHRPG